MSKVGESPNEEKTSLFIDEYLKENYFDVNEYIKNIKVILIKYLKNFKKSRKIFGVFLVNDISIYLTVNRRLPYNLEENYFLHVLAKKHKDTWLCMSFGIFILGINLEKIG